MKKLFEPVVGCASALAAKAENMHEVVSDAIPCFSFSTILFYLMIGFLGALGGWLFKVIMREITNKIMNRK